LLWKSLFPVIHHRRRRDGVAFASADCIMPDGQQVFIVDDDADVRDSLRALLEAADFKVRSFSSAKQFLDDDTARRGCLIADIRMPDMSGLELQQEILRRQMELAVIVMTGHGDVPLAVRAMKAGAIDFLEKPFDDEAMLASVRRALVAGSRARSRGAETRAAKDLLALLTPRECSVLDRLVQGRPNKIIAHELGISPRTVEIHRAHIMGKMVARSLSDLVRVVMAAGPDSRAA
jgi:two-component system response regulator FixJ